MRSFFTVVIILIASCNYKKSKSNKVNVIELGCDSFINSYSKLEPCAKLALVKEKYPLNNSCYEYISNDMYKLTGVSSSMEAGHIGLFYSSDSMLLIDITKWKNVLKCN